MGIGLGRNSPVKLSLSKDNYCALIERHGQWIRWRIAQKCACVKFPSMQPDVHCKICGGRGYTYSFQKSSVTFEVVMDPTDKGILEISESHEDCELIEVYDYDGNRFENAAKLGKYVYLNSSTTLKKGVYYNVILRQETIKTIEKATAEKTPYGYYKIPGMISQKASTESVYYGASGDIISIGSITDANGTELHAKEFRLNQFIIEETEFVEPITVENVTYVPPFIFGLLNQNLSQADAQMMVELQGDAILIYPYEMDVANDDVLTVMAGTYTQKETTTRKYNDYDVLGAYFVYDVISCTGVDDSGNLIEYQQGTDFVLFGTNGIKWLDTAENYPEKGETYSISYHILPTYKVIKNIPNLRTSENQRFPKKAIIKLFNSYSQKSGVNKQEIGRKPIEGSY